MFYKNVLFLKNIKKILSENTLAVSIRWISKMIDAFLSVCVSIKSDYEVNKRNRKVEFFHFQII